MKVILFDIDGTLIRSGGAGKWAIESALQHLFGLSVIQDGVSYAGRTDPGITHDLLVLHGIEPCEQHYQSVQDAYLERLPESLKRIPGHVLPGVRELVAALQSRHDCAIGLLTGNSQRGAACKLGHFDLWHPFPFGGFGDKHFERHGVAREAFDAAELHLAASVDPQDVWVIGDTPLDVTAARSIGAQVLAVATGWCSVAELEAVQPDWILSDLTDTEQLMSRWF